MAENRKPSAPFPTREAVLEFINEKPGHVGKREIARAFNLDAEQKRELKKLLRQLTIDGSLQRRRGRKYADVGTLPEVSVLNISRLDQHGDLMATPTPWPDDVPPPRIYMAPERKGQPALGIGDRVLARLTKLNDLEYKAKTIRRLASAPAKVLGVYHLGRDGGRLQPTDKRQKSEFIVPNDYDLGVRQGELVRAEVIRGKHLGLRQVRIVERLGHADGQSNISAIAVHENNIPDTFSKESLVDADGADEVALEGRMDLRNIPFVTIDGADARDFDDAVWAEPDPNVDGGWHIIVAIADVSWYVRPGSPLDHDARERGNSVYFPDRVVPMLPEALSNGLCSLRPGENRPCLAVHMWIASDGGLTRHNFVRGLMKSTARLTYSEVQTAHDGRPDGQTAPLMATVIEPLYGAFATLLKSRNCRSPLELDVPERRIEMSDGGTVRAITKRKRLDSHRLIEEFMITANVAAAETLEKQRQPCMYRIHDRPSKEKAYALNQFLRSLDLQFAKGQVPQPRQFNQILSSVEGEPEAHMVNQMILRSQAQAEYSPHNIGHFGLALRHYAHFTSPIRRYADLLVHRALVSGLKLGAGGLDNQGEDFEDLAGHISATERRAAKAERDAADRFTALYLADQIGAEFAARVNGVSRAGLFVTLQETGADGLVPIRTLPNDYYDHDPILHTLTGTSHGLVFGLAQELEVRLEEAMPLTGGLIMTLVDGEQTALSNRPERRKNRVSDRRRGPKRRRGRRRS